MLLYLDPDGCLTWFIPGNQKNEITASEVGKNSIRQDVVVKNNEIYLEKYIRSVFCLDKNLNGCLRDIHIRSLFSEVIIIVINP
jgi:hypothetical protein